MNPEIQDVLRAQNRRRRIAFWVGFLAILLVGSLWAGLSKDPLNPAFFGIAVGGGPALSDRHHGVSQRRWHRRPTALFAVPVAAVFLLLAVVLTGPAGAQDENDGDEFAVVDLEVLGAVPWEEGRRVSSTVSVETRRAVSGTLLVTNTPENAPTTTYEFDIDLAAGTTVNLPVTLRTGWNGVEAEVALRSDGDVIASDELTARPNGDRQTSIVAVLDIEDPPLRVPEIGSDARLTTVPISSELQGLETASTLITSPRAIADLESDSEQLLRLEGWILGGGQLVVDGPTQALDGRFHQFPTANPDRFSYGVGSVVYADDWRDGVPLGGYLGEAGMRELVNSQSLGSGSSGELGLLAGISLPSVGMIAGVLIAYSLIAGPLLFLVVSARNMHRRIWVFLPVLSLLFVVGIVGFGFLDRTGTDDVHITIVEVNDQGSRATSNLLLTSNIGGNRSVDVPDAWTFLGQARTEGQRPVRLRVGSSETEVSFEIPPGGNATARMRGSAVQYDGTISIDNIRVEGDELLADVTNSGTADLSEVLVFNGNLRASGPELAAGETATVSLPATDTSTRTMQELLLWPRVEQQWTNSGSIAVPIDREASTAAGSWTEWRVEQGSAANPENVLGIVGWTDDLPAPIGQVSEGRTALFARVNIPADVRPAGFSTAIRLPNRNGEPEFFDNFGGFPQEFLVTLEPGTDPERLAVQITRDSAALSFWIDGEWQYASLEDDGEATVAIPEAAIVDGQIRFRSFEADWSWGVGLTALVVVDEDAVSLPLSTDASLRNNGDGPRFEEGFPIPPPDIRPGRATNVPELASYDVTLVEGETYESSSELPVEGYDSYQFELAAGQTVLVSMRSARGDSYLEIFDETGELIDSDDDSGNSLNSRLEHTADTDGLYEVRALALGYPIAYAIEIEVVE